MKMYLRYSIKKPFVCASSKLSERAWIKCGRRKDARNASNWMFNVFFIVIFHLSICPSDIIRNEYCETEPAIDRWRRKIMAILSNWSLQPTFWPNCFILIYFSSNFVKEALKGQMRDLICICEEDYTAILPMMNAILKLLSLSVEDDRLQQEEDRRWSEGRGGRKSWRLTKTPLNNNIRLFLFMLPSPIWIFRRDNLNFAPISQSEIQVDSNPKFIL